METLAMSSKERRRLDAWSLVRSEEMALANGAELLGLGYRQLNGPGPDVASGAMQVWYMASAGRHRTDTRISPVRGGLGTVS